MLSRVVLLLLVGLAAATDYAWKSQTVYEYNVYGRTLTSWDDVANQFSGILIRAKLNVQVKSEGLLSLKLTSPKYARVHADLPDGWLSEIEESELEFLPLPLQSRPFEVRLENGLVKEFYVHKNTPNWEVNIYKSVISQLQLNVRGENQLQSRYSQGPDRKTNEGTWKTMEDTVVGTCETMYDVKRFPEYQFIMKPWIAPLVRVEKGYNPNLLQIIKTKNHTACAERIGYHYGLEDLDGEPDSTNLGDFFQQSTYGEAIVSTESDRYTIQSSTTVHKVIMSPTPTASQKGLVGSYMNITLVQRTAASGSVEDVTDSVKLTNLVYNYNQAFDSNNLVKEDVQVEDLSGSDEDTRGPRPSYRTARRAEFHSGDKHHNVHVPLLHNLVHGHHGHHGHQGQQSQHQMNMKVDLEHTYVEQRQQQKPTATSPPQRPFLPFAIGFQGQSIKASDKINIIEDIVRLAKQISKELETPSEIPKKDTLAVYSMLVRLLRIANLKELQQISAQIYSLKQSKVRVERNVWTVFRDAVAQTGTFAALNIVHEWITSGKIEKNEAAEVLSAAINNVRYPSEEYMTFLFNFMKHEKVQNQAYVNETAILGFSDLVRSVYVDKTESHRRFPVHVFGKLIKTAKVVATKYIPYFAEKLTEATNQRNSHKTLLYIRALGNLAHIEILPVFKPYLEGEIPVTHFQRLAIVTALDKLVLQYPKALRAVLYKIYSNANEKSEIRALAVHQLMRTVPPADMLQRLAQNTNVDTDEQVNSAIKSAIQSAAELRDTRYAELAANAQTALKLLSTKNFGAQYSTNWLVDYVVEEMDLKYKQSMKTLGSKDSFFPKGLMYSLRNSVRGYSHQSISVQSMVSSIERITQVIVEQTVGGQTKTKDLNQEPKFSAANIAKHLHIKQNQKEMLEGYLDISNNYFNHFYTLTNRTIERLPEYIRDLANDLSGGKQFNYTKLMSMSEVTIGLPTATGLPFMYTFENPIVFSAGGKLETKIRPNLVGSDLKLHMPETINATLDLSTFVSQKTQVRFGFVTPFDHQQHMSGYDKKIQINLPVRHRLDVDLVNNQVRAEIRPLNDRNTEVLHYSTWVYTAQHDLLHLKPIAHISNVELIGAEQTRNMQILLGRKNGIAFRLNVTTQDQNMDYRWMYDMLQQRESLPTLLAPFYEDHLHTTNISLIYDSDLSDARAVVFNFKWISDAKSGKDTKPQPEFEQVFSKISEAGTGQRRVQKLISDVGTGISSAFSSALDMSIQFPGSKYDIDYNLTVARSWSIVDDKIRYLVYGAHGDATQKPYRLCVSADRYYPKINALDFWYALKFNSTSEERIHIGYGQNCVTDSRADLQTRLYKSDDRKEYLRQDPMAHECAEEMKEGNNQMDACRNMTIRANRMDRIDVDISYHNIGPKVRNATYKAYDYVRYFLYPNLDENIFAKNNKLDNFFKIRVRTEPSFESLNITIDTETMSTSFKNVRIDEKYRPLFSVHPEFTAWSRVRNQLLDFNGKPACVLDKTAATTFDNLTYPLHIVPDTWYVAVNHVYNASGLQHQQQQGSGLHITSRFYNDYSILLQETAQQKKQLKIVVSGDKTAYDLEIRSNSQVLLNGKAIQINADTVYEVESGLIRAHTTPKGYVMVHLGDEIQILYDSQRVKIGSTSDNLRGNTRGICGTFDGQETTDFTVPENCMVRDPRDFVAMYSLASYSSNPKAKQVLEQAKRVACPSKVHNYTVVITEEEWTTTEWSFPGAGSSGFISGQGSASGSGMMYPCSPVQSSCTRMQTALVEEDNGDSLCFSLRPLPTCQSPCKATKKVVKSVDVHCVQKSKVSTQWKDQITRGASPDFSQKPTTKTLKIKVDQACEM